MALRPIIYLVVCTRCIGALVSMHYEKQESSGFHKQSGPRS